MKVGSREKAGENLGLPAIASPGRLALLGRRAGSGEAGGD